MLGSFLQTRFFFRNKFNPFYFCIKTVLMVVIMFFCIAWFVGRGGHDQEKIINGISLTSIFNARIQ